MALSDIIAAFPILTPQQLRYLSVEQFDVLSTVGLLKSLTQRRDYIFGVAIGMSTDPKKYLDDISTQITVLLDGKSLDDTQALLEAQQHSDASGSIASDLALMDLGIARKKEE